MSVYDRVDGIWYPCGCVFQPDEDGFILACSSNRMPVSIDDDRFIPLYIELGGTYVALDRFLQSVKWPEIVNDYLAVMSVLTIEKLRKQEAEMVVTFVAELTAIDKDLTELFDGLPEALKGK